MALNNNVITILRAGIDELKTDLAKGLGEFKQFGHRIAKTIPEDPFEKLKSGIQDLGQVTAAVAPFVKVVKDAAVYDQSLRDVNKIMKLSEDGLTSYGEKLRTIGQDLGVTAKATDAAAAAERIASAGFEDAASNAKMLGASLQAATAGKVDAGQYAQFLAQTLQGYGASADDAAKYTDILFRAVQEGITEIPELANTLGRVTGIAGGAGVKFEELGAIMATTTLRGSTTSAAVDGLRGAIVNLQAPSSQARKELDRIGVSAGEATLKKQGLIKTLQDIAKANGNSAESWKIILGDIQAVDVAQKLMVDGGAKVTQSIKDMGDSAGYTAEAVKEHMKGAVANWEAFTSALQSAGIAVGQHFLPAVITTLQAGTDLVKMFAGAPPVLQMVFTAVAALGAAYTVSSKAIMLLTTAAQRERAAMLASRIAKIAHTQVTWAGTRAYVAATASTVANTISLGANALAAKAAAFSWAGLGTAMKAAMLANPAGLIIAGLAAIGAGIVVLTNRQKEANKAAEDRLKTGEKIASMYREERGSILEAAAALEIYAGNVSLAGDAVAKSLIAQKKNETDVAQAIAGLVGQLNQAQEDGLHEEAAKISERIKVLKLAMDDVRTATAAQEAANAKAVTPNSTLSDKAVAEAAKRLEAQRKKDLDADLHAVDLKKRAGELSARQEVAALEQILKAKGASLKIEEKQRIEAEIATANGKIKADNEKRWADAAKKSAEAGKQAAKESFDLQQQKLETERDGKKTIEEKLEIEKQLVDLEAQKALYSEKNKKNRAAILENAKAEKDLLEKQAKDEAAKRDADLAAKRTELAKETASEEQSAQTESFEKRRRQLDEEEGRGRNVRAERLKLEKEELAAAEAASKRKLQLAKEEAAAKRKAADVDASPAEQKINAEREALEIRVAEREAAKESQEIFDKSNASLVERLKYLREQLELMKMAKEEAKGSSFSGPYGLDQINENLSGWGVSKSRRGQVNQDGMTEAQIQQEISATEGRLGNRKEARRVSEHQAESGFGTSKWDQARAQDKANTEPTGQYSEAISAVIGLLQQIAKVAGNPGQSAKGPALGYSGVPYQLQPNTNF